MSCIIQPNFPVNHSDNNELLIKNKHVTYKNYNYDILVTV